VPYRDPNLPDPKFRLYSIDMKRRDDLSYWNIMPMPTDNKEIEEKFKSLQNYCESLYRTKYPADFYLKTISKVNNRPEYIKKLDHNTKSVFLGIFLKAVMQITERKLKEDWEIVCATGDLKYYNADEKLCLLPIDDVPKKYNDEFKMIAEENKGRKCLFLYISDKEEKEVPQGTSGNLTVKWFSPDDTIDDIFDCLYNGIFPPILYKVNLNMYNIKILKKYLVKSYLEDFKNTGFSDDIIAAYFKNHPLDFFEGYISASVCLLYLVEEMLYDIKEGKCPKDMDEYLTSNFFLRLMGNFNNEQRSAAVDKIIPNEFDDDFVLRADVLNKAPTKTIADFCPPRQSKAFYAAWNRFCVLFCGYAERNKLSFIPSKLKYRVLDSLNHCLNEYLKKHDNDTYKFYGKIFLFIIIEFKVEVYEDLVENTEKKLNEKDIQNIDESTWKEQIIERVNFNDNDRKSIEKILNNFNNKKKGLQVAVDFLFSKSIDFKNKHEVLNG